MAIKDLRETFLNLRRLREVVATLHRHGFDGVLFRMGLDRWLGLGAKVGVAGAEEEEARAGAAERLVAALEELGAAYIKFGQVLSTRPDILPPEYVSAFARLQDKVEPLPYAEMLPVLAAALPGPPETVFASFDPQAVASGSVGQVYFAVLRDGSEVVVKVKRPGTDQRMQEDLSLLRFLAGIIEKKLPEAAVFSPTLLVEEFARGLNDELNFVTEAAYTEKFYQLFDDPRGERPTGPGGRPVKIRIPRIYWDYCGRDVLVEERLPGRTLSAFCADLAAGRGDPAAAAELADAIARCFLEQYFIQGFFHSDPHPGNFLVGGDNAIGIIDFGQTGQLSREMQRNFVGLLVALGHGDTDAAVDLCCAIAAPQEGADVRDFRNDFGMFLNRFYGVPFNRLRLGEVVNEAVVIAQRHGFALPRDLVLLGKSLVTVQGLVCRLSPGFRLDEAVRPFIRRVMADWLRPGNFAWSGAVYLYRLLGVLKRLPEDLRDLIRKAGGGRVRIIFHHEGLEAVGDQVERASNRITLGLLIAAILLGSSIILAASPEAVNRVSLPLLSPVPLSAIIAGLGYLAAMGLGFWLAWAILRGKRL